MPKAKKLSILDRGPDTSRFLTQGDATELIDTVVRAAIGQQARMLEKHLADINIRLSQLEQKKR